MKGGRHKAVELRKTVTRIQAGALAVTGAIFGGLGLFCMTLWLLLKGGPQVGLHLQLLGHYLAGYTVTWFGSAVGLVYGALLGGVVGWSIATIYNRVLTWRQDGAWWLMASSPASEAQTGLLTEGQARRPLNILMIAPQPFFEPRGTPFSVLARLQVLAQLGHRVTLLTYHCGQAVCIPGVTISRIPAIPGISEVPIGPSRTKLILDVVLVAKAIVMMRRGAYDLLHTHEEAAFFGVLLAKWFRVRHLYDMHSSLPQQLENFQFTCFRPLVWLFAWLERATLYGSDAVITISPALAQHAMQINPELPHRMIENVVIDRSPRDVSDEELRRFQERHDLPADLSSCKIVLYTGTFEAYQGLDLLVASAERVLQQRRDVLFLVMEGKPKQVRACVRKVEALGLSAYFRFTGTRPPAEMPSALRLAHVLLSPRVSGTNTPLKIYAYLEAGKPIVATNLSTHTQVLSADVTILVEPEPEAMAQGLLAVCGDDVLAQRMGRQAQQFFADRYHPQTFIDKTEQILSLAMGTSPAVNVSDGAPAPEVSSVS